MPRPTHSPTPALSLSRLWNARCRTRSLLALILVVLLALPPVAVPVLAQDGKRGVTLSWADAPLVPRHRSPADWLVDVGQASEAEMYGPFLTHEYAVGESETFIPLGDVAPFTAIYSLRYRSAHAYWWFERGTAVDQDALQASVDFFETRIWPLNNAIYGSEWNPGIDGDPRLHIINQERIGSGIMGAFSPRDQCPRSICPDSNQREILYINLGLAPLNSSEYLATVAHEHQHLIQHHVDGNEDRWMNEGLSQLAEHLNGFDPDYVGSYNIHEFLRSPDRRLNAWPDSFTGQSAVYGAAYLWMVYLYERFGLDFIQHLASSDYDGLAAVQDALWQLDTGLDVDSVFADWVLANLLDNPYISDGRYYYQTLDLPASLRVRVVDDLAAGYTRSTALNQYGAHYLRLDDPGAYRLDFDGTQDTRLLPTSSQRGGAWWSYQSENGAARMTGAFDLSDLTTATLQFRAWWDIEDGYDWFQVLVSRDGEVSWDVVGGPRASRGTSEQPGPYYSGRSAGWVDETIDLSAYAGRPVLVRLEYLTDGGTTRPGIALDDLAIPELRYYDTVDESYSPWHAEGFMRIPAQVRQGWAVAIVTSPGEPADDRARVRAVGLDDTGGGSTVITVPEGGTVTVALAAMAPFTGERASYTLSLTPLP